MKLYLHIGTNKTGTSAIQHFFNENRRELMEQGLLYPKTGCSNVAHYDFSNLLGFAHGKQPATAAEQKSMLESLKNEVSKSAAETCVISSEYFMLPKDVAVVKDFFADFDCRIVVYLRRHDQWLLSVYNQAIKTVASPRWERGFHGYLTANRKNPQFGNYRSLLDRWAQAFGQENILVRPYERTQNQPNIIADFFATIARDDLARHFAGRETPRVNTSLDARSIFLLEIFQRMNVKEELRRALVQHVVKNSDPNDKAEIVPAKVRRGLAEARKAQYEYIATNYLKRPDGVLFQDPLPDPEQDWVKPNYPTIVEVAEIVATVVASAKE